MFTKRTRVGVAVTVSSKHAAGWTGRRAVPRLAQSVHPAAGPAPALRLLCPVRQRLSSRTRCCAGCRVGVSPHAERGSHSASHGQHFPVVPVTLTTHTLGVVGRDGRAPLSTVEASAEPGIRCPADPETPAKARRVRHRLPRSARLPVWVCAPTGRRPALYLMTSLLGLLDFLAVST